MQKPWSRQGSKGNPNGRGNQSGMAHPDRLGSRSRYGKRRGEGIIPAGLWAMLLAGVLALPLLFVSDAAARHYRATSLSELGALALLGFIALGVAAPFDRRRLREVLAFGPGGPILGLILYGAASALCSSAPDISRAEWIRLVAGAALYFAMITAIERREQLRCVIDALLVVAVLTSLCGIAGRDVADASGFAYPFGNRQLLAGFLLLLTPLALVLAFGEPEWGRRLLAQGAAAASIAALALAQTRSAWLGLLVALGTLGVMALRLGAPLNGLARAKHQLVVPVMVLLGGVTVFVAISHSGPMIAARVATLGSARQDPDFVWRWERWRRGGQLIREHPLFGWGIGTYPLEQARITPGSPPRAVIRQIGPSLSQEAHNDYLQTAVELGLLGLGLYLWVLRAFFTVTARALRHPERGFRTLVVMGCFAGLAGQVIDALSNPAWRFAGVSLLFWVIMGVGVAAARMLRPGQPAAVIESVSDQLRGPGRLAWRAAVVSFTLLAMATAWVGGSTASPHPIDVAVPYRHVAQDEFTLLGKYRAPLLLTVCGS